MDSKIALCTGNIYAYDTVETVHFFFNVDGYLL